MTWVLAFGHSQLGALSRGHELLRSRGEIGYDLASLGSWEPRFQPLYHHRGGGRGFNPAFLEAICERITELEPAAIVLSLLGAEPYLRGVINDPRPYDFVLPDRPELGLSPNTELIPYDPVAQRFRDELRWQFDIVVSLREFRDLPLYHIEAPPPVADPKLMEPTVYGRIRERMEEFGCPSVTFRYKAWLLFAAMCKDICAELGLSYVEGPPESRDAQGFLAERYFKDGVHGTDEYGSLIALGLEQAMQRSGMLGD
jgi:hypothetical protein